jgi:hypothetical protein
MWEPSKELVLASTSVALTHWISVSLDMPTSSSVYITSSPRAKDELLEAPHNLESRTVGVELARGWGLEMAARRRRSHRGEWEEEEASTGHDLPTETPELEIRGKRLHKHFLGMEHDARQHLDVPPEHSIDDGGQRTVRMALLYRAC